MARAAVNAKAKAKQSAQAKKAAPRRPPARRGRGGGGNPNQQLFFTRLRRRAKYVYVLLAVLFALTFAFLGVGSGSGSGLDQLFNGLNIFHHSSDTVGKAQKEIKKDPKAAKGYRDLAKAYEGKGDTADAISAWQQYTTLKPKDVAALTELAGLQMTQAQDYLTQYQNAYQNRQLAAPTTSLFPTGKLGQALGQDKAEQVTAQSVDTVVQDLQQKTQLAFSNAVNSYTQVTKLTPKDANAWFQLAQAAQQSGDYTTAVKGYKQYLKLNPESSSKAQIEQLIKQLSPVTPAPAPKKKK
jgi:tetratricopeptide (TPR) repeat protein